MTWHRVAHIMRDVVMVISAITALCIYMGWLP